LREKERKVFHKENCRKKSRTQSTIAIDSSEEAEVFCLYN